MALRSCPPLLNVSHTMRRSSIFSLSNFPRLPSKGSVCLNGPFFCRKNGVICPCIPRGSAADTIAATTAERESFGFPIPENQFLFPYVGGNVSYCDNIDTQGITGFRFFSNKIMKKYGLLSEIRRPRKWVQMGQQVHKYENLLNREFHADRPNAKWVTDISYIHTGQGVLYLSMIRDLYDNSIERHTRQSIWCWTPSVLL